MYVCTQCAPSKEHPDGVGFETSLELGQHHRDVHGLPHSDDIGQPRVAEAVAAMHGSGQLGGAKAPAALVKMMEDAESAEVLKCLEEGISLEDKNADVIRERKRAAARAARDKWYAAVEEYSKNFGK
jgi:hypothetical protein